MIRGGQKLMNETMQKFNEEGKTNYTTNNFAILPYIKKVNYFPQLIKNFSPYSEDADLFDIVSATIEVRGQIEEVEEINKIPLEYAETLFKSSFDEVMTEGVSGKIYLFKLPTAIGKTTSITSCVATTIATPTNDLKNEISTRMEIEHECSPDEVIFENEELNRKLNYYYSIGLPKKATAVIHDVVNGTGLVLNSQSDRDIANNYLNQLEKSNQSKTTVLTTHTRALHTDYSNDTLIFDEDPLNTLIAVKTMEISDLVKIKNNMKNSKDSLGYIIDYLDSINPGEIVQTPLLVIDLDELVKNISYTKIDTNVFGFFDSCYLYKDIHSPNTIYYVVKKELPKDKKVIIMSATIPIYLYQKIYGERVEVIDISDVQQMGSVTQYTQRSCSRNGLKSYHQIISEMVGEKPVITFKSFQNKFKNPVSNIYFGNCSGYDTLKGKDIAVVGTPHRDVVQYFLIARVLGIEIKITDSTMSHQKIEYNGFKFMFCCFDNEELRNIQLSLIESDLIQAVGRARTLRTNAKVEVYSNFPLRISNSFEY